MQALAVYNRPVSPAAIDYLLQPHLPSIDSALVLNRLVNMHFARKESGRFYLHPADQEYAISTILEGNKEPPQKEQKQPKLLQLFSKPKHESRKDYTRFGLLDRAADYFVQARKPRAEWKKLDDLAAQLAEFDLRWAAGDYDTAARVLIEIDGEYLLLWGHYRLMIEMHERLQGKIKDSTLARVSIGNLGKALYVIGKVKQAISNFEKALFMAREAKNRQAEGAWLGNLSNVHADLGETRHAIDYYEQALVIVLEVGDRLSEGTLHINLGDCYYELGETKEAIEHCEQAIDIFREIQELGGESMSLGNLGGYYIDYGNVVKSIAFCKQSIQLADEIGNIQVQSGSRFRLSQAYLYQNNLVNARATIEAALQYDEPLNNHNATALHGIIALRQGEMETAQEAFTKSIAQADEILAKTPDYYSALDAKGLALCGLAICDGNGRGAAMLRPHIDDAIATFQKARKIAPHAGVVKSMLRLFDELVKCDREEILKDVREAVEGKEQ
jgi:tetratricopeptide (TPR) repeat protein